MDTGESERAADLLLETIRRRRALEAIATEPVSKRGLAEAIDVSGATAHRILTTFREAGVVERTAEGHVLTGLGRAVTAAANRYRTTVTAAVHLEPFLSLVDAEAVAFPVDAFADATVTVAEPVDPYRPLARFVDLLQETDSLRGFDTTSVSPTYVDDVHERILDGMSVEIVYDPAVIDRLTTAYADQIAEAFERENLTAWVADEVPFGLALFDDRIGVGGYDPETGLLQAFVDTDDPAAIEWGERTFERVREDATRL